MTYTALLSLQPEVEAGVEAGPGPVPVPAGVEVGAGAGVEVGPLPVPVRNMDDAQSQCTGG